MKPFLIRDIGGITIEGEKPLQGSTICIHGGPGGNCLTMYPFFPSDSIAGRWYFVDLPNHGRSADTNGDWSKEKCIEVLQHFACARYKSSPHRISCQNPYRGNFLPPYVGLAYPFQRAGAFRALASSAQNRAATPSATTLHGWLRRDGTSALHTRD